MPEWDMLERTVYIEYGDIIEDSELFHNTLRFYLIDGSYVDIWFSAMITGRFSYHWERRNIDNTFYRHDNMPHKKWRHLKTFPKHFHNGSEKFEDVRESRIDSDPKKGIKEFFDFVRTLK